MTTEALEVERKYDVEVGPTVPPLGGCLDGAVDGPVEEHLLVATYLDRRRAARGALAGR